MTDATDVKLEFICREIKELKEKTDDLQSETKSLREDINKGKGAIWLLLIISGIVASVIQYFKN